MSSTSTQWLWLWLWLAVGKADDYTTYITYNYTEELWHCCGDRGCTGTPTDETFQAAAPSLWTAVPSARISSSAASAPALTSPTNPTQTSSTADQSNQSTEPGLSTAAKAGIGVAAAIAAVAIITSIIFFALWRRARSAAVQRQESTGWNTPLQDPERIGGPVEQPAELPEEDAAMRELSS